MSFSLKSFSLSSFNDSLKEFNHDITNHLYTLLIQLDNIRDNVKNKFYKTHGVIMHV